MSNLTTSFNISTDENTFTGLDFGAPLTGLFILINLLIVIIGKVIACYILIYYINIIIYNTAFKSN